MPRTTLGKGAIACALALSFAADLRADDGKAARHAMPGTSPRGATRSAGASGGFWLGTAGIAVALAAFGALSLGARTWRPGGDPGPLKVIGRASLTPRQSVFLLRAGERVFLVGAGGQGPPSLLGELSEDEVLTAIPAAPARRAVAPIRIGGAA
jgi:hypothetical protein